MSKFLVTAAQVVGAVVAIAAAIPTGGTSLLAYGLGVSAATASIIAATASIAVSGIAALAAKKPTQAGSPSEWRANPDQGIDLVFGDAYNAGGIIHRTVFGKKNKYQTIVSTWSLGPVLGGFQLYVDGRATAVAGQAALFSNGRRMFTTSQVGQCPEPAALMLPQGNPPGWTAQHKLSGKAAFMDLFVYDAKGKGTFTSIPNCARRGKGLLCYDPRKDSTYAGGVGPQRWDDQTTWAWSNKPAIVALSFAIGWKQNGKLAGGCGMAIDNIIVDQFVEAANVGDANGWTCGGVKSTTDNPHDVMVDILQAGGIEILELGARLGCLVNTPRVRLATIDKHALAKGPIVVPAMASRRTRINGITPTYLFEQHVTSQDSDGELVTQTSWAEAPGAPIVVPEYVAADGKERRKPVSYPLVQCFAGQQPKQIAQLARYDIENSREIDGISLPLKLHWYGYKPGDCLGVDLPEAGLHDRDILLRSRQLEPGTGVVTMTARTETAAKHPFALGQTTTAPASPSTIQLPDFGAADPEAGAWEAFGTTTQSPAGTSPGFIVSAANDDDGLDSADAIVVEYRPHSANPAQWISAGLYPATTSMMSVDGLVKDQSYDVAISYRSGSSTSDRLILDPVIAGAPLTAMEVAQLITNSKPQAGWAPTAALEAGGQTAKITIAAHNRIYQDETVAVNAGSIGGLAPNTYYALYYDDPTRAGGAVAFMASTNPDDALPATTAHPGRHYLGDITTPAAGSTGGSSGSGGTGGGGVGGRYRTSTQ